MPLMTVPRGVEPWRRRLYLPAYQVTQAAKYAGTSTQTVAYWHYRGGQLGPTLPTKERRVPLSYLQLVDVAFVATFRALGVSLQRIRKARQYARQTLNSEHPFAEYRWLTEGHHMMLNLQEIERDTQIGRLIVADAHGQIAWKQLVGERFAEFDYEHDLAIVWHVAGRQSRVAIDPRIAFGAPMVSGLPTWVVAGRWKAGESPAEIVDEFQIAEEAVRDALRFEGIVEAA